MGYGILRSMRKMTSFLFLKPKNIMSNHHNPTLDSSDQRHHMIIADDASTENDVFNNIKVK